MEDLSKINTAPQQPKKKGLSENQKSWITFGTIAVIGVFGGAYLLLLPTPQEETAKLLAGEIKAYEGKGYKERVSNIAQEHLKDLSSEGVIGREFKKGFTEAFNKTDSNFTFSGLREFEDGDFGAVEIKDAIITSQLVVGTGPKQVAAYSNFIIKQLPKTPNKYYFSTDGENKEIAVSNGQEQTSLITKYSGATGNFELDDVDQLKSMDTNIKQMSYTDGSGTITYATLEDLYGKFSNSSTVEKLQFRIALGAKKIEAGDSIKMMLGPIQAIGLNMDFSYSGDPISKITKISDAQLDKIPEYLKAKPEDLLAEVGTAEKYNAQIKLNDFSLASGEMGFVTNFDLTFSGFPYQPMPRGNFSFTIKNYPELIAYARNFFPIEQEKLDAELFSAKEYFSDDGKNLVLKATFDGSRIIKLGNGREIDVVEEYTNATEIKATEAEIDTSNNQSVEDVQSEASPVLTPEIQTRELGKP